MDDVDTSNQSSEKQSSNSKPVFAGSNINVGASTLLETSPKVLW